jgi:hypothetical protein
MDVKSPSAPNASGAKSLESIGATAIPMAWAINVPKDSLNTFDVKEDIV